MLEGVAALFYCSQQQCKKEKAAMPASIAAFFISANLDQKLIVSDAENVVPTSYRL